MAHCDSQSKSRGLTRRGMMQSVAGALAVNEFDEKATAKHPYGPNNFLTTEEASSK